MQSKDKEKLGAHPPELVGGSWQKSKIMMSTSQCFQGDCSCWVAMMSSLRGTTKTIGAILCGLCL